MDDLEESGVTTSGLQGLEAAHEFIALVKMPDDEFTGVVGEDENLFVFDNAQEIGQVGVQAIEKGKKFGLALEIFGFEGLQIAVAFLDGFLGLGIDEEENVLA